MQVLHLPRTKKKYKTQTISPQYIILSTAPYLLQTRIRRFTSLLSNGVSSFTRSKMNGGCYMLWCLPIINEAKLLNDNSSKVILYCLHQKIRFIPEIAGYLPHKNQFCRTIICDYWRCAAGAKIWIVMQQKSLTNF